MFISELKKYGCYTLDMTTGDKIIYVHNKIFYPEDDIVSNFAAYHTKKNLLYLGLNITFDSRLRESNLDEMRLIHDKLFHEWCKISESNYMLNVGMLECYVRAFVIGRELFACDKEPEVFSSVGYRFAYHLREDRFYFNGEFYYAPNNEVTIHKATKEDKSTLVNKLYEYLEELKICYETIGKRYKELLIKEIHANDNY